MSIRGLCPLIRSFSTLTRYYDQVYLVRLDNSRYKLGLLADKSKWENVVYINLPKHGERIGKGENIASVECDKTVFDIESPVNAKVIAHNEKVLRDNNLLENDPEGEGWLMEVEVAKDDI
ncbi:glycine cleavage system H protein [Babesia microti strain RI]|uniref:Glycine cleavage system H protein n=1 Tax=Babesia microti (strain RI) TaxID=1133968 RepID=I7J9G1_BABMR|nr:glycine cleavage system H protein [Babesia microti strain RI]CCF75863.2 glycine cleavage system H protein [Babesia microti strain RI]|eukprot:XP_012650271.2 glycine cleavage system H protein [Babesia microti strain RI]